MPAVLLGKESAVPVQDNAVKSVLESIGIEKPDQQPGAEFAERERKKFPGEQRKRAAGEQRGKVVLSFSCYSLRAGSGTNLSS
jgi:hypothetical protein